MSQESVVRIFFKVNVLVIYGDRRQFSVELASDEGMWSSRSNELFFGHIGVIITNLKEEAAAIVKAGRQRRAPLSRDAIDDIRAERDGAGVVLANQRDVWARIKVWREVRLDHYPMMSLTADIPVDINNWRLDLKKGLDMVGSIAPDLYGLSYQVARIE